MGRSGYTEWDDYDEDSQWAMIRAGGALKSALRGKRGQDFLKRLAAALDAMPVKSLCAIPSADDDPGSGEEPLPGEDRLGLPDGGVCILGSLALAEGHDPANINARDHDGLASMFRVAPCVVRDLEYRNDESYRFEAGKAGEGMDDGPARWRHFREWVGRRIKPTPAEGTVQP